jgi:dTDP-6-deoxy-L-talose 4-dehydrogenase (NAD+)
MRALVTGGAGFIGREVVRLLVEQGHDVTCAVRTPTRPAAHEPAARVAALDLDDAAATAALLDDVRPEAVVHLAWYAHPRDYLTSTKNLASLRATTALAELVAARGIPKFVGAGSCVEYAPSDRARREDDPCAPASLYGACKHAAWLALRALFEGGATELAWGRIFHLHGPREAPERLLPWIAGRLRAGDPVELTDGVQVRDHLHVEDVARGLVALLQPGARGAYNVCSGEPVTLRRVIEALASLTGGAPLLRFGARPHRPGEIMHLAGSSDRLRGLGWSPRHTLEGGLRDALAGWTAGR